MQDQHSHKKLLQEDSFKHVGSLNGLHKCNHCHIILQQVLWHLPLKEHKVHNHSVSFLSNCSDFMHKASHVKTHFLLCRAGQSWVRNESDGRVSSNQSKCHSDHNLESSAEKHLQRPVPVPQPSSDLKLQEPHSLLYRASAPCEVDWNTKE